MEADWEVEIGGDAAVIDAAWPGFIDLRMSPEKAAELVEVKQLLSLSNALCCLNVESSPVFTSKCDVWQVDEIDPYEFDATPETAVCGFACYIDLLPAGPQGWNDLPRAIEWCSGLCLALRGRPLRCCRADLIIREVRSDKVSIGVTAYLAACAVSIEKANLQLSSALAVLTDAVQELGLASRIDPATMKERASSSIG